MKNTRQQINKKSRNSFVKYNTYKERINGRQAPDNLELLEVQCNYCNEYFKPTKSQITNRLKKNGTKNLLEFKSCRHCNKLIDSDIDGLICSVCKKKYISSYNLGYAKYDIYSHQLSYAEEIRKDSINNILEVKCTYCGEFFKPTLTSVKSRIKGLTGIVAGENRLYCCDTCKDSCPIYRKHSTQLIRHDQIKAGNLLDVELNREVQPELRKMVLARDNYTCQKCNKHKNQLTCGLHCHHIEGIRWEPIESADLDMCITYCEKCHIKTHQIDGCKNYDMRCL